MSQPRTFRTPRRVDRRAATLMRRPADTKRRLTMRLSDAGLRCRQTKLIDPDHRLPPWLTEDATRDRSNRLLDACADIRSTTARACDLDNRTLPAMLDQRNAEKAPE
jgi:hypothetical protein